MTVTAFLSYAREDAALVRAVASKLRTASPITPWVDEHSLSTGARFPERIRAALDGECAFAVVFLSEASVASNWVRDEVAWALEREAWLRRAAPTRQRHHVPFVLPIATSADFPATQVPEALQAHQVYWPKRADRVAAELAGHLRDQIFCFCAKAFVAQRPALGVAVTDSLEDDLRTYQDLAYRLTATLRDSVELIARDPRIDADLTAAIIAYNQFSTPFNQRLPRYAAEIRRVWGANLGRAADELAGFFETQVFRGQVYALNRITATTNALQVQGEPDPLQVITANADKDQHLATVQATLADLAQRASDLVGKIRQEAEATR
jgi:hypothetical protein